MDLEQTRVPIKNLTARCDPDELGCESTLDLSPLVGTAGQERALQALEFGLRIQAPGYNLFVSGTPGTGRNTTVAAYLEKAAAEQSVPPDWCYVHNFDSPSRPLALSMPPGRGITFAKDIDELVASCRTDIPKAFEGDEYRTRVEKVTHDLQERRAALLREVDHAAKERGFSVTLSPAGIVTVPLKPDGEPIKAEEFERFPDELKTRLRGASEELQSFIQQKLIEAKHLEKEYAQRRTQLDREVVTFATGSTFGELKQKYRELQKVLVWLDRLQADVVDHAELFKGREEEPPSPSAAFASDQAQDELLRYKVNVIVNNSGQKGAPVVFEFSPTYYNLFGRIEYRPRMGTVVTDITLIKPGALHRANGGFLVVQAKDLLASFMSWDMLKRALRAKEVRIENLGEQFTAVPTVTFSPEPIPLDAKIVIVGPPHIMRLLQLYEEDFSKFFKVKADFDVSMPMTKENLQKYASFVCSRVREQNLLPFHKTAIAKVVEYSSRLVEHQEKLTTRFMDVADLVTEANYWACQQGDCTLVMGEHVGKAIREKVYRANLTEERIHELIRDGIINIDTSGVVAGQVNGISVLSLGDYSFGMPIRITARTSLGRGEVANIDHEAQMSGRIHNKGFMILVGYLMGKYGHDKPLSVKASISFEQTYDEVEGDSASCAELYTLLSSMADIPIKQGLAVTGSVNQHGQVQAVGGVTHKIEGFFAVCKAKGLDGTHGVIIPASNVKHLVLREDVVEAVKDGKFHIYSVKHIEEGIELLTGMPAGVPTKDGAYPSGTVNYHIDRNLRALAKKARQLAAQERAKGKSRKPPPKKEERPPKPV